MAVRIIEMTRKLVNIWFLEHAHCLGFRTGKVEKTALTTTVGGQMRTLYTDCRL